jgi:hypothetical protein
MQINLEDCGIVREDIQAAVVHQIVEDLGFRLDQDIKTRINSRIDEIVNERIGSMVDDLLTKPYQPLDIFGDKRGEPTTIKDLLAKSLQTWWTAKVDDKGKPQSAGAWGANKTRAEWMVGEIAKEVITNDLRGEAKTLVDQLRKDTEAAMKAHVLKLLGFK